MNLRCDHLCRLPDSRRDTIHTIHVSIGQSFRLETIGRSTIELGAENFEPVFVLPPRRRRRTAPPPFRLRPTGWSRSELCFAWV